MTPLAINQPLSEELLGSIRREPTGTPLAPGQAGQLEEAIYQAQSVEIKNRYGEEAANSANYGWAVIVDDDLVGVGTKVYNAQGGTTMVLSSEAGADGTISHAWVSY